MRIQNVKAMFLKVTTAAVLAGAVLIAAPKANAQHFAVGVQFGAPAYGYNYGPAYGPGPGYYEHLRWEREQAAIARRDAWIQQERWEHRNAWERQEAWEHHDGDRDRRDYDGRDFDRRDFNGYPPRAVPYNGWR